MVAIPNWKKKLGKSKFSLWIDRIIEHWFFILGLCRLLDVEILFLVRLERIREALNQSVKRDRLWTKARVLVCVRLLIIFCGWSFDSTILPIPPLFFFISFSSLNSSMCKPWIMIDLTPTFYIISPTKCFPSQITQTDITTVMPRVNKLCTLFAIIQI